MQILTSWRDLNWNVKFQFCVWKQLNCSSIASWSFQQHQQQLQNKKNSFSCVFVVEEMPTGSYYCKNAVS